MNKGKSTIERALELAASGQMRTVTEIAVRLRLEGFGRIDSELQGAGIRKQLREKMVRSALSLSS